MYYSPFGFSLLLDLAPPSPYPLHASTFCLLILIHSASSPLCFFTHTFFLTFHHNIKLYQGADSIAKLYFNFPKSSDLKAKVSVFCLFQIRISHKNLTIKVCFKIQIEGENEDTKYGNSLFSVFFFYFLTPTFPPVVIFVWRCCSYHYSP